MRKTGILLAAALALGLPAAGQIPLTGAGSNGQGAPAWFPAGASIGCDFTVNQCYQAGVGSLAVSSLFTTTRTLAETATDAAGALTYCAVNTLCVSSAGAQQWEARTNKLTQSESFSTWTATSVTLATNNTASPDGNTNATLATNTSTTSVLTSITFASGTSHDCVSLYAKINAGSTWVRLQSTDTVANSFLTSFNLTGVGSVGTNLAFGNGSVKNASVTRSANGFYRIVICGAFSGTANNQRMKIAQVTGDNTDATNSGDSAWFWGAQYETVINDNVGPYIPTTTASATRPIDNIVAAGAMQTALNSAQGTIVAFTGGTAQAVPYALIDSNGVNLLGVTTGVQSGSLLNTAVGASLSTAIPGAWATPQGAGLAWDGSGGSLSINGASPITDAQARTPATTFHLGSISGTSNSLDGNITKIIVYSTKISDAALATATFINPTVPAAASARSFTTLAFYDNFSSTSTIDLSDTLAAGFKWYIHNTFPANANGANSGWATELSTSAGLLSIGSGYLTISNATPSQHPVGVSLMSCGTKGSAPGYVGSVFGGGFYVEVMMSFDPSHSLAGLAAWPVWWTVTSEELTGAVTHFPELDGYEALPIGTGTFSSAANVHDWIISNGVTSQSNQNTNGQIDAALSGYDFTKMHRYGRLWVPASKNSGTGLLQTWIDGVHITANDVTYQSGAPATPGATPSNPNGTFFIMESDHLCLILGAGTNWPANFGSVQVWQ